MVYFLCPTKDTNTKQNNTMNTKQFNNTLTALLAASETLRKEKSITALAKWCDKVKDFESLAKAAKSAARSLRKDDSVPLTKRLGLAVLTLPSVSLKPRKVFRAAMQVALYQAKRVKTIHKSKEILSKRLAK
jgi:hypothetical protein